jgi:hypothetical protein
MNSDKSGYVYILSNPAMPGILKIGRSSHGGRVRAKSLYTQGGTGVPMPFKMEFEIWSEDCASHESNIHEELSDHRINKAREFFRIDICSAMETVMNVVCSDYNLTTGISDMTITENDLMAGYGYRSQQLIDDLFGGVPAQLILKSAIAYHLSADDVNNAVIRYKDACDARRERMSEQGLAELSESDALN